MGVCGGANGEVYFSIIMVVYFSITLLRTWTVLLRTLLRPLRHCLLRTLVLREWNRTNPHTQIKRDDFQRRKPRHLISDKNQLSAAELFLDFDSLPVSTLNLNMNNFTSILMFI